MLAVQVADFWRAFVWLEGTLASASGRPPALQDPIWDEIADRYEALHVVFPDAVFPGGAEPGWDVLASFAATNKMAINTGYFARVDQAALADLRTDQRSAFVAGDFDSNVAYVIKNGDMWAAARMTAAADDLLRIADGQRLLLPGMGNCTACGPVAAAPVTRYDLAGGLASFEGWSASEGTHRWSEGGSARIDLALLPDGGGRELCAAVDGFTLGMQTISVHVDGGPALEWRLDGEEKLRIPLGHARESARLQFTFSDPQRPGTGDPRRLAFAVRGLTVAPCP